MRHTPAIRISAGRFKGHKIALPDTEQTRPTKSIVRESLFDTLQNDLIDTAFVEVFAGSGSVGLEALSRGCETVCFMEKSPQALRTLKANLKSLGIHQEAHLFAGDSFVRLGEVQALLKTLRVPAWFYFDPPFDIREQFEDIYAHTLTAIERLSTDEALGVIIEHRSAVSLPAAIGAFSQKKQRKFGKTTLSYYLP
jgi:16S rRNA (guanine(966)-N(2))-methyltransferase RsmD